MLVWTSTVWLSTSISTTLALIVGTGKLLIVTLLRSFSSRLVSFFADSLAGFNINSGISLYGY